MPGSAFIIGATGFIGRQTVTHLLADGWRVTALIRDPAHAGWLNQLGVNVVVGTAEATHLWAQKARGCNVLIDLMQPKLPRRLSFQAIRTIADTRLNAVKAMVSSLLTLPSAERPLVVNVSGLDDLQPDNAGQITDHSGLRQTPVAFSHIGIPVRKCLEQSGLAATYVYLGTVYGPGKAFAKKIVPQIALGKARIPGSGNNHLALVSVEDAARALAHIARLPPGEVNGKSWIVIDQSKATLREFFDVVAEQVGSRKARTVPVFLASLFAGKPMIETMTRDVKVRSSALADSGFKLSFPSYRDGLPHTLAALGYPKAPARPRARPPWLLLFAITITALVAENTLHFRYSVPTMRELAHGQPILDMRFGYTFAEVQRLFSALGTTGRQRYLELLWSVDLVLPALMGLFLWNSLRRGSLPQLSWLAFTGPLLDYAENVAITLLLTAYPNQNPHLAIAASMLTCSKLSFYFLALATAIVGFTARRRPNKDALFIPPP